MRHHIWNSGLLFLTSIAISGCAATIITKAEMSGTKIKSIKCEPIALTVYYRDQLPPRGDASIRLSFSPDPVLRDKVISEREKAGCIEEVEIRDIKAERVDFKFETFPMDFDPVMYIVPSSHERGKAPPRKTADAQFFEYLNAIYPKSTKKWILMGFRRYGGVHTEESLTFAIHVLSLGLIPIWNNEDYDLEVRVIGHDQKFEFHQVKFDTRSWSWLPFIFRVDSQGFIDTASEVQVAPAKRVFGEMNLGPR